MVFMGLVAFRYNKNRFWSSYPPLSSAFLSKLEVQSSLPCKSMPSKAWGGVFLLPRKRMATGIWQYALHQGDSHMHGKNKLGLPASIRTRNNVRQVFKTVKRQLKSFRANKLERSSSGEKVSTNSQNAQL